MDSDTWAIYRLLGPLDLYARLQLSHDAEPTEIRDAYRKRKVEIEAQLRSLEEAMVVLINKRRQYDDLIAHWTRDTARKLVPDRARCPVCDRALAVRSDGCIRVHQIAPGERCDGSMRLIEESSLTMVLVREDPPIGRNYCSVCGKVISIRKHGGLRKHPGPGRKGPCDGSGEAAIQVDWLRKIEELIGNRKK